MKNCSPRARTGIKCLLLAVVLAACGPVATDVFRDESMDFAAIRTVAVMPLSNQTRETLATERVRDVFATTLLSTGAVYVIPPGEVNRGISRAAIAEAAFPAPEDIVKFGSIVKVDAVIIGVIREYGEVRSGNSTSQVISLSMKMIETQTGRVVWSASSTQGGISFKDRLLGGGGLPMNQITEKAVNDIIDKMFR
ncbi:MAG: penicillin-binding protein activator LpoB [Nitrospirae bacterium GWD2_57_9]|nr:MAG: penicillin-binding protein activator LpoB [Nitrospirae bacterium GWD2_57_9]OGW45732.1 MAG: penicillin-binding protein activator LpoB [Nitrospirae bacterium GWC2_57_9]